MQLPYRKPGKFSKGNFDPFLTKEKFAELTEKLRILKQIKQPRAAEEVARLAELGDFSENAEYQLAKGRLRGINMAILTTENQLKQADIIKTEQDDAIEIGHYVTVEVNGKTKTFQILGSSETDPEKGIISHTSPIGLALLDHRVGETVTFKTKNGEIPYRILAISSSP